MEHLTKDLRLASQFRMTAINEMRRATHDYRAQMQKFLVSLAKDVSAHRRATTKQVMRMSGSRRKAASQMRADLEERTLEFRNAAAEIVPALSRARQKMATRQKASLEACRRKLGAEVTKLRSSARADIMKAHEIWSAFKLGGPASGTTRKH
jgi:hypothetical protein